MSTKYLQESQKSLSLAGARIVVLRGVDRSRALRIEKEEIHIGTAEACDLVLKDPTVSRNHVSLCVTPSGYLVTDLGSTNGTLIEGHRVRSAYLEPRQQLKLGETVLRLEELDGVVTLPLSTESRFGNVLGQSIQMRRLFALLGRVARENVTVLLQGETGTGKDLVAEAIHQASPRAAGPLVVLDCGALAPALLESEIFGHERGAFTGATSARVGAFVAANGGTLFIDEVGKLPLDLQPKFLRAIERREVRPLGAGKPVSSDVRIVAASDIDLRRAVNSGAFREDLFYRLSVISITLPPLRDRPEDIPLLAGHFLRQLTGDSEARFSKEELASLVSQPWAGNVRELRNAVEQSVALSSTWKPSTENARESYKQAKARVLAVFERQFVMELLIHTEGNISRAAQLAQMDRLTLLKLIRRHEIKRPS
jgi:DNA-binding NtrC family response regulator